MAKLPSPVNAGVAPQPRPSTTEQFLMTLASQAPGVLMDIMKNRREGQLLNAQDEASRAVLGGIQPDDPLYKYIQPGFDPATLQRGGASTFLEGLRSTAESGARVAASNAAAGASTAAAEQSRQLTKLSKLMEDSTVAINESNANLLKSELEWSERMRAPGGMLEQHQVAQTALLQAQAQAALDQSSESQARARLARVEADKLENEVKNNYRIFGTELMGQVDDRVARLTEYLVGIDSKTGVGEARQLALTAMEGGVMSPSERMEYYAAMAKQTLTGDATAFEIIESKLAERMGFSQDEVAEIKKNLSELGSAQAVYDFYRYEGGVADDPLDRIGAFLQTQTGQKIDTKKKPFWRRLSPEQATTAIKEGAKIGLSSALRVGTAPGPRPNR